MVLLRAMSTHPPPGASDPFSAFPTEPKGPLPHSAREPRGSARVAFVVLAIGLAIAALAWVIAVVTRSLDFFSGDCNLFACSDHTFTEHVRVYTALAVG